MTEPQPKAEDDSELSRVLQRFQKTVTQGAGEPSRRRAHRTTTIGTRESSSHNPSAKNLAILSSRGEVMCMGAERPVCRPEKCAVTRFAQFDFASDALPRGHRAIAPFSGVGRIVDDCGTLRW
jgi:hypothetical protein